MVYPQMVEIANVPKITADFQRRGFLNCAGAINGPHVPFVCPHKVHMHMSTRKDSYYSLIMLTIKFIKPNVQCTSRLHDTRVLWRSGFYLFEQEEPRLTLL